MSKRILVTGSAGFIGFHVCNKLLEEGYHVLGVDSLSSYYDINLKFSRNKILVRQDNFKFSKGLLEDMDFLKDLLERFKPEIIVHLAAQAGVRYSIDSPKSYLSSNLVGTFNILELAKIIDCKHLLLASTSSVYGADTNIPFNENSKTESPLSFYAATKKSCEVMSFSYAHLYDIPTTCIRFFTVYGPWGRPDMALFKFTNAIFKEEPIILYNKGNTKRDFTYIADTTEALFRLISLAPSKDNKDLEPKKHSNFSSAPWRSINISSAKPILLENFVDTLENLIGKKAKKRYIDHQLGDMYETFGDTSLLRKLTGFEPQVGLEEGINKFLTWYKSYFNIS